MKWLAALLVITPIVWTFAPSAFRERMFTLNNLESDYNTTDYMGREQVWKRGLGYWKGSPIWGVGVGNFQYAEGRTLMAMRQGGKWSAAHNSYLEALVDLGAVGFGIFIALLWNCGRIALRYCAIGQAAVRPPPGGHRPELLASLVALAVSGFFLSFAYFWGLFALFGIVAVAGKFAPVRSPSQTSSSNRPGRRSRPMRQPLPHMARRVLP
jgi:O-antigen ligase